MPGTRRSLSASQAARRKHKGPSPRSLAIAEGELIQAFVQQKQRVKARVSSKHVDAIIQSHPLAPPELAGKWIAWSGDNREIVAYGDTLGQVRDQVAH